MKVTVSTQELLEFNIKVTWSNGMVTEEPYRVDAEGLFYADMFRDDEITIH